MVTMDGDEQWELEEDEGGEEYEHGIENDDNDIEQK